MIRTLTLAALGAMTLTAPSGAHHSTAMFDQSRTVTLEGVVKEFQYTNPHSWLLVDVTDENGEVTTWGFEAEGPSTLARAGIRKSTIPVGARITVTGSPMRDGRPAATFQRAELEDGTVLEPFQGFLIR